ncbi:hypothetical protein [Sphingomonas beigongshangi]|uniref:hypothetical protein n=1 Tax=Sphingomonas beigongshangi TaxID=2782540 RepID=UPI00193C326E|nr:hypothetical protein [Sphingomonas beigongshangi]
MTSPTDAARAVFDQWDKHPDAPQYWHHLPSWVQELAAACASPLEWLTSGEGVKWRERWYGSEPQRGSAIVDERGNLVAYLGGDEATHTITTAIVAAHNAALAASPSNHAGSVGEAKRCATCGDTSPLAECADCGAYPIDSRAAQEKVV